MASCVFCGHAVDTEFKIGRLETCNNCGRYLHCCLQCIFFDRSYHNSCRENQAPLVSDKEGSNFCEFFKFGRETEKERQDVDKARNDLDALFKKG